MVTAADLMAQLAAEADAMKPQEGEFTIAEFARASKLGNTAAARFLDGKVKAGELKRRQGMCNGKRSWLYSAVNQ
jgi:hypothetical protein